MGPKIHTALHKQAAIGWQMSTSEDMRWKGVEVVGVSKPPKLLYRYFDSIWLACHKDEKMWATMLRVSQFVEPPTRMFSGRMARKAIKYMFIGNKNAKTGPKPAAPIVTSSAASDSSAGRVSSTGGKDVDESSGPIRVSNAVAA